MAPLTYRELIENPQLRKQLEQRARHDRAVAMDRFFAAIGRLLTAPRPAGRRALRARAA